MYPYFENYMPSEKPPTLYSIMQAIAPDGTRIVELPEKARGEIFDFDYDLTDKMPKAEFERAFLFHFMDRRIGFETVTAFKIHLMDKLRSNIGLYNSAIESLNNKYLLSPDDVRIVTEKVLNDSTTNVTSDSDVKFSDVPQNKLDNVKDGKYVSEYTANGGTSESIGNSESNRQLEEHFSRADKSKVEMLMLAQKELKGALAYIWDDMDSLFYQLF